MKKMLLVGLLIVGTVAGFAVLIAVGTVAGSVKTIFAHNSPDLEAYSTDEKAWVAMHVL